MYSYLLQTQPTKAPELTNAVESLTKTSIDLAEAASNYGALKVIFGIFLVFIIVFLIMFVYTIVNLNKKVSKISESTAEVTEFFSGVTDHTIGSNEAHILIRRTLNDISAIFKYYILRIRLENHIDDKVNTSKKVDRIVNNEYSELCAFLSNYFCNGRPLSEVVDGKDCDAIKDFMLEQIYIPKTDFTVSAMDQSVTLFINGMKQIYLKKL